MKLLMMMKEVRSLSSAENPSKELTAKIQSVAGKGENPDKKAKPTTKKASKKK